MTFYWLCRRDDYHFRLSNDPDKSLVTALKKAKLRSTGEDLKVKAVTLERINEVAWFDKETPRTEQQKAVRQSMVVQEILCVPILTRKLKKCTVSCSRSLLYRLQQESK